MIKIPKNKVIRNIQAESFMKRCKQLINPIIVLNK